MTEQLHFHFSLSCIGEGNGNPLQCSCLENPRDRGAWWAAVYGVAQSRTRLKRLSSSSSNDFSEVVQSCPALCDPVDCSLPGSSVHGIFQAIVLEWIAININTPSLVAQTVKNLSTMRETWVQSLGWKDLLEKETAIHSSTIAWKIPWAEEPGRLQSMRSQRVGHD